MVAHPGGMAQHWRCHYPGEPQGMGVQSPFGQPYRAKPLEQVQQEAQGPHPRPAQEEHVDGAGVVVVAFGGDVPAAKALGKQLAKHHAPQQEPCSHPK